MVQTSHIAACELVIADDRRTASGSHLQTIGQAFTATDLVASSDNTFAVPTSGVAYGFFGWVICALA